jgi:hypothetical protein
LKVANLNGYSDPYVKVSLTGDKKFVRRTRKILKTTKPQWNQHFQFNVRSIGKENLKLKVYDSNSGGGDDRIGQTTIEFRRLRFGIPVNDWLPLDCGKLRVCSHIGRPGDRPFATSNQIVPFLVRVFIVEATNVPKMDRFCKLKLLCDYEWAATKTNNGTLYPIWDYPL